MYQVSNIENMKGSELYAALSSIKEQYQNRQIGYDTAKEAVEIMLVEINKRGKTIAKKHGKTHRPITAGYVLR